MVRKYLAVMLKTFLVLMLKSFIIIVGDLDILKGSNVPIKSLMMTAPVLAG